MSYNILLFRKEVKEKQLLSKDDAFLESEQNLISFTKEQKEDLKNRLIDYGYFIEIEKNETITFGFSGDGGTSAMLTDKCLYFTSTGEGVFEISMTASEFTDTDEFAKYDPQEGGWEELE